MKPVVVSVIVKLILQNSSYIHLIFKDTVVNFLLYEVLLIKRYLLPPLFFKHGKHTPSRTKDVERFWETVIVYQPSVDREQSHHQNDITPLEECVQDLHVHIKIT